MARMKTWVVKMWRSNPQLKNGGYYTTRTVKAATESSALKKADKEYGTCSYGSMYAESATLEDNG